MLRNNVILRIILDVLILFTVISGWWFIAVPLVIFGVWFRTLFIEALIAGLAYDALFGMSSEQGMSGWAGTITAIVLYTCILLAKRFIRK